MNKKGLSKRDICAKFIALAYTGTLGMSFVFACNGGGFLFHDRAEWTGWGQLAGPVVEKVIGQ